MHFCHSVIHSFPSFLFFFSLGFPYPFIGKIWIIIVTGLSLLSFSSSYHQSSSQHPSGLVWLEGGRAVGWDSCKPARKSFLTPLNAKFMDLCTVFISCSAKKRENNSLALYCDNGIHTSSSNWQSLQLTGCLSLQLVQKPQHHKCCSRKRCFSDVDAAAIAAAASASAVFSHKDNMTYGLLNAFRTYSQLFVITVIQMQDGWRERGVEERAGEGRNIHTHPHSTF